MACQAPGVFADRRRLSACTALAIRRHEASVQNANRSGGASQDCASRGRPGRAASMRSGRPMAGGRERGRAGPDPGLFPAEFAELAGFAPAYRARHVPCKDRSTRPAAVAGRGCRPPGFVAAWRQRTCSNRAQPTGAGRLVGEPAPREMHVFKLHDQRGCGDDSTVYVGWDVVRGGGGHRLDVRRERGASRPSRLRMFGLLRLRLRRLPLPRPAQNARLLRRLLL